MKTIIDILQKQKGLKGLVTTISSNQELQKKWTTIFGAIAQQISFGYLRKGELLMVTENPGWVTEIGKYKNDFIKKINKELGRKVVKEIRIKVGQKTLNNQRSTKRKKTTTMTLEQKIKLENDDRKKRGYRSCESCGKVWSLGNICIFCENDKPVLCISDIMTKPKSGNNVKAEV